MSKRLTLMIIFMASCMPVLGSELSPKDRALIEQDQLDQALYLSLQTEHKRQAERKQESYLISTTIQQSKNTEQERKDIAQATSASLADLEQKACAENKDLHEKHAKALQEKREQLFKAYPEFAKTHTFNSLQELQAFYRAYMKKREAELTEELLKLCALSQDAWQKYLTRFNNFSHARTQEYIKKLREEYDNSTDQSAIRIIACIKAFLSKLDDDDIEVLPYSKSMLDKPSAICSHPNLILFHPAKMDSCLDTMLEAIILHERAHIIHSDTASTMAVQQAFSDTKVPVNLTAEFRKRWDNFQEIRADIEALIYSCEHTKARIEYMQDYWSSRMSHTHDDGVHPTIEFRLALAQQLYQEMLSCKGL